MRWRKLVELELDVAVTLTSVKKDLARDLGP